MPEQSFRIRATPAIDFVMPSTPVCFEIERVGSHDKVDALVFNWCRVDDPMGREPPGQVRWALGPLGDLIWGPTSGPHGQGEKRWYCDGWKGPGEHLILCEVIENGAHYQLRYPQRVDDMISVLSKGVAVPMHAEDPLAWRDRLREKLDAMQNLERITPTDPSRTDDAEKELTLHGDALRRIELLIRGITKDSQSWPIAAVHADPLKGRRTELRVCAIYFGPGKWAIVDWTAPTDRRFSDRWEGETFPECEMAWTSWWSSRYPKGRIEYSYDIGSFPRSPKHFDCSGSTLGDDIILAGALLGAALMIAVPVFGLAAAVLASGIVSTVASAGYSVFDRHRDGIRDWRTDAFDVLTIVSCTAGGLAAAGRFGVGARVLSGAKVFRALVATDVVATSAEALLMTETSFEAIKAYARNDKKTPAERLALIAQLVQTAASGTFAYLNVRAAAGDLQLKPLVSEQLSVEEKLTVLRDPEGELHLNETPKMEGHTEQGVHETTVDIDAERQRTPTKAVPVVQKRITDMVPGLYESIGKNMEAPGWTIEDKFFGGGEVLSEFVAPDSSWGKVVRKIENGDLVFEAAFLHDAPTWIRHGGVEMDATRGTPTIAYLTMRQMHLLGIPLGGCSTIKMSNIQNVRAIVQLERLTRGGMPIDEAVRQTHSVRYAETAIVQSGHVMVNIKLKGGSREPLEALLRYYESRDITLKAIHDRWLKEAGVERADKLLVMYDIYIEVAKAPE